MTQPSSGRFALYWAPPAADPLWRFGARWLGRDPETAAESPPGDGAPADPAWLAAATAEPRHYGLHATLKPPFRLAEGRTREALVEALASFAARTAPVAGPALALRRLGRFLAITGMGPAEIRAASAEPGFLAGVLDYVASDERLIADFAAAADVDPADVGRAHVALGGSPWERENP